MNPESRKRLRDAHGFCGELVTFLNNETRETFLTNRRLRYAVLMLLVHTGEALSVLRREDAATAGRVPDLHRFVALRNHLVHGYDAVNLEVVWRVATEESPALALALAPMLVDDLGHSA